MMTVICSYKPDKVLRFAKNRFDTGHKKDWFNDPLVEAIVLDVDRTTHIKDSVFESPRLGTISPHYLSGGTKALISLLKSDNIRTCAPFDSAMFGDNCVRWLTKISFLVDFTIYMDTPLDFGMGGKVFDTEFRKTPIQAQGENGEVLDTCGKVWEYYVANSQDCDE